MKRINLKGRRFGRWKVLHFVRATRTSSFWRCRCRCGTERDVRSAELRSGASVSCGCYRAQVLRKHALQNASNLTGR